MSQLNGSYYDRLTLVLSNLVDAAPRAMARDPVQYPDPDRFLPERFLKEGKLDPDVRNPRAFSFGFGRRWVELVMEYLRLGALIHNVS